MEGWLNQIASQGVTGVLLVLLLYFIWRKGWPSIESRLKRCDEDRRVHEQAITEAHIRFGNERREARKEFTNSIRARDVMIAEIHENTMATLTNLTEQIHALRDEIKGEK